MCVSESVDKTSPSVKQVVLCSLTLWTRALPGTHVTLRTKVTPRSGNHVTRLGGDLLRWCCANVWRQGPGSYVSVNVFVNESMSCSWNAALTGNVFRTRRNPHCHRPVLEYFGTGVPAHSNFACGELLSQTSLHSLSEL